MDKYLEMPLLRKEWVINKHPIDLVHMELTGIIRMEYEWYRNELMTENWYHTRNDVFVHIICDGKIFLWLISCNFTLHTTFHYNWSQVIFTPYHNTMSITVLNDVVHVFCLSVTQLGHFSYK